MNNQVLYLGIMAVFIVGVLIFSRERLKALLAVAVFISPWQGGLWLEYVAQDLLLSTILYAGIAVLIVFSKKMRKTMRLGKRLYLPVLLPALGMIIGAALSTRGALDPFAARSGVLILVERYLAFFCIYNLLEKPSDIHKMVIAIAGSILFQSLLGLIQFRMPAFHIGVIDADQSWQSWRANGTFFHANALGMYLVLLLTLLYRFLLISFRGKSRFMQRMLLIVFVAGLGALVATQNRGSWIGFVLGMIVIFLADITMGRTRVQSVLGKLALPVIIVVFALTIKYGDFIYNRLFHDDMTEQIEGRKNLQETAYDVIKAYPVFGVGWGNYQLHAKSYEFTHNLYLLIASELGIVGLIFFIWLIIVWFWEIVKGWRDSNLILRNVSLGGLAGIIGFLLASIPGPDYLIIRQTGTHLWIVLGILAGLNRISRKYSMRFVMQSARRLNLDEEETQKLQAHVVREWESSI